MARGDVRGRRGARPARDARRRRGVLRRGPAGGLHDASASSTTSTTAPTGRPTRSPTSSRWPSSRRRARSACASCCCWPPTRAGARAAARAPGQRRFCDRSVEAYLGRVERLAAAGRGRSARDRRLRAALAARRAARVARRDRARTPSGTGYPLHIHAGEQPREIDESLEEFGLRPIEHLDDCGAARRRRRPSCTPRTSRPRELDLLGADGLDRVRLPDDRGQPRRRLPAGRRAVGARRAGLVRLRLQRPPRSVRGGARDRGLRAPPERPAQRARGRGRRRGPRRRSGAA